MTETPSLTAATVRTAKIGKCPNVPQTIEELGLPPSMLIDLSLRYLREHNTGTLTSLRKALKLSLPIADWVFQQLRQQQLVDVKGTVGNDYVFALTALGRGLAVERSTCRYTGPSPVPLDQYCAVVQLQGHSIPATPEQVRTAMCDLVLRDDLIGQLGAALVSGKPIFMYGETGNGKTSIIERLPRLFTDSILVPYCLEVDGHIISIFDPAVHLPLDADADDTVDQRWTRCHRPCVIASGELVAESLSLWLDETSGVYAAPLQMKAQNGILLIDDFGRQAISPRQLFNRWILPLDRHVDHLSLRYGYTFRVPFEISLVFSTNLEPTDLADDAFLRRVPNKVHVAPITADAFDRIFELVLKAYGLPFDPDLAAYLRELCRENGAATLRGCFPTDICSMLASLAAFEQEPFAVSRQSLARAAKAYFVQPSSGPAASEPS
jgi:hypothetical protein